MKPLKLSPTGHKIEIFTGSIWAGLDTHVTFKINNQAIETRITKQEVKKIGNYFLEIARRMEKK